MLFDVETGQPADPSLFTLVQPTFTVDPENPNLFTRKTAGRIEVLADSIAQTGLFELELKAIHNDTLIKSAFFAVNVAGCVSLEEDLVTTEVISL